MSFTTVRYRTKPEQQDRNRALVEAVIAELEQQAPEGFRYMVLQLDDGTFIHLVDGDGSYDPSAKNAAFKDFVAGLKERQAEPTVRKSAQLVGQYRMLATDA
jgi:hypothetical protein